MKRGISNVLGAALLGAASLASATEIDVMTQNQYLGADLTPVLAAATVVPFDDAAQGAFNAAVVEALHKIALTRPAERARALAAEIQQRNPDVVGLQEAYEFRCIPLPHQARGTGCDDPWVRDAFTNHLTDTVAALRGKFTLAGQVTNLQVPGIPFKVGNTMAILALADRDAILVRKGLPAAPVDLVSAGLCTSTRASDQGCNYNDRPPPQVITTSAGELTIAIERGFLAVDLQVKRKSYRVFNTHLEQRLLAPTLPETRLLQVGQANQLVQAALQTGVGDKTVIVVGDMNSAPGDVMDPAFPGYPTPYQLFLLSGFTDAWTLRSRPDAGLSCCQAEDLRNRKSQLYERIDMIFSLTRPTRVVDARLLGDTMGDKTRPPGRDGLWPSDHAAVAATLQFGD